MCELKVWKTREVRMNDGNDILFDQQVKQWLEIYNRLFGNGDSSEERKRKLARLKKIREA